MEKRRKQVAFVLIFTMLVVVLLCGAVMLKGMTPSKTVMDLNEYYKVAEDEILILIENEMYEKKGLYIDGVVYVDYNTVVEQFNKRFYWDKNENLLVYTTPNAVINTEVGSKNYYINNSKNSMPYQIVKTSGDLVYVALDYVKQYSNLDYEIYENPNRIVIQCKWGTEYLYGKVKKNTQLRYEPDIKSDILEELKTDDILTFVTVEDKVAKGFGKVITKDGVIGYVKQKHLGEAYSEKRENDYKEEQYTHISKDYKINMVWHQVTNREANDNLLGNLENTKGVTTISPTWFSIISNEGEISSLASELYVERAHNAGIEVWALCDDFNKDVSMSKLLTYTSRRKKLINELIANAIKYNLDGINIDFEKIKKDTGPHYIQFLRELSVKCRNNGIVLSVDSYVPSSYTEYYDREEQGVIIDYVVVMAYDEHHASSEISGSVSSIGFVKKAISDIIKAVPPEKVIIGIPLYTRLWEEDKDGKVSSSACGMNRGREYLTINDVEPKWNEETGQYYGEYEQDGMKYRIWLEEDESIELKMKAINEAKVAGVSGWKLTLEKSSIWDVIMKYVN